MDKMHTLRNICKFAITQLNYQIYFLFNFYSTSQYNRKIYFHFNFSRYHKFIPF